MAFESQARVGLGHALTVINDLDTGFAGIDHVDLHRRGTGVDCVLNQFLYHRGRPLYDLAGCDLVRHGVR